jgi:hypothetical protein
MLKVWAVTLSLSLPVYRTTRGRLHVFHRREGETFTGSKFSTKIRPLDTARKPKMPAKKKKRPGENILAPAISLTRRRGMSDDDDRFL